LSHRVIVFRQQFVLCSREDRSGMELSPNCRGVMRVVACELPDEVATMYTSQSLMGCLPARTHRSDMVSSGFTPYVSNSEHAYSDIQRSIYSPYGVA
jgi:hypothetical protein